MPKRVVTAAASGVSLACNKLARLSSPSLNASKMATQVSGTTQPTARIAPVAPARNASRNTVPLPVKTANSGGHSFRSECVEDGHAGFRDDATDGENCSGCTCTQRVEKHGAVAGQDCKFGRAQFHCFGKAGEVI